MSAKWLFLIAAALLAGILFWTTRKDPMRSMKQAKVETFSDPELTRFSENVLSRIRENDMKGLYKLMTSRDTVMLDVQYRDDLFRQRDFCPAEIGKTEKIERGGRVFYYVQVKSISRKKSYVLTVLNTGKGYALESIAEAR